MGRGRHYTWWRRYGEKLESLIYGSGWAARLSFSIGLQGVLRVDRRDLLLPVGSWPEPLRVAFVSDLHAGPLTSPRLFENLFDAVRGFSPHLLLLGGDYVSLSATHIRQLTPHLQAISPTLGTFAVLGNHDLWADDTAIVSALEASGVTVLINQQHRLPAPFSDVGVFGLDEPGTGNPNASPLTTSTVKVSLVLMHSPLGLPVLRRHRWHLAFCGHTHGGQIALPGGIPIILPRGSGLRRHASGRFLLPEHGGGELLVSRGVGMSDLPIRMFAPSEVHFYTLFPSSSQEGGRA